VAWGELDVCGVGILPRHFPGAGAYGLGRRAGETAAPAAAWLRAAGGDAGLGAVSREHLPGAASYFSALFGLGQPAHAQPLARYVGNEAVWALCLGTVFSMPLWEAIKNTGTWMGGFIPARGRRFYFGLGQVVEIALVVALLLISAAWLAGGTYNPFIYFRF